MNLINLDYINEKEKELVDSFISSTSVKKYILGINKLTKSILKHVEVDGIIDDFTRVQRSRKKEILNIEDVPKGALILWTSTGSPLEVKRRLGEMGFKNISYLAFYKYSSFELAEPPFITDFKDDFKTNFHRYERIYQLLADRTSKEIFEKVMNFKISFDYNFMEGFTNDHEGQYFDKELIPNIKDIVFMDGGGYVGDTLPQIMKYFKDYKKIYLIEPNLLHINIAKRDFGDVKNIEFINCGLGDKTYKTDTPQKIDNNCNHNYQAQNIDTIDNIVNEKVDYIKLDIEGAEQEAIEGAKETIKKFKPILAICVYHNAEDWYKVPEKILAIESGYDIYLRHYMEGIFESVIYFIPKEAT